MSTLTLDSPVGSFEPAAPRLAPAGAQAPSPARGRAGRAGQAGRHGRRAQPAAARRASAASTLGAAVVVRSVRHVAVRALGTGTAAAAVALALAAKADAGSSPAALASTSVRGLAAAAILCAAWGFQDRNRLGRLATARAWYGTAVVLGLAHASWLAAALPGAPSGHLGTTLATLALDVVLVAAPALLGARAARRDTAARPAL